MQKQERVYLWDNLKFFLIFLVVLGHFASAYYNRVGADILKSIYSFIFAFHMPAFFFVMGLFAKKTVNGKEFPYKKVISYVILGFLLMIFDNVINVFIGSFRL